MPTTLQFRRYGTAATASVTGANGELTIDTDKETVIVHDGSTAGGYALVRDGAATISDTFGNLRGIPISGSEKVCKRVCWGMASARFISLKVDFIFFSLFLELQ